MVVTLGQQYNVGETPTCTLTLIAIIVSHIQRIGCKPEKPTLHGGQFRAWSAEQGNVYSSVYAIHPGEIIGCKYKRAPMVVSLGQQYHVGACFSVAQQFIF